ncbi:MAG: FHA domain-containing protein [Anaerolineae bacterium]|nr:FHA domain-containing protein [Anaerolineae bacterium]
MITVKVCPSCKHENKEDASFCIKCGTILVGEHADVTTRPVSDEEVQRLGDSAPPAGGEQLAASEASLALFIGGQKQPVVLRKRTLLYLGRDRSPEGDSPLIDPELGLKSGVSRQHALISCADDVYTIKDLGSTNGSLLNGKRMLAHVPYVLQSGDQIRLGKLVIYIYFKT